MAKKTLPILLLVALCFSVLISCNKTTVSTADTTVNYFPITLGRSVTYDVDSITYLGDSCYQLESRKQLKYAITDTYRDNQNRLSYIMDVYSRPQEGGDWQQIRVITMTPAAIAPTSTNPSAGTPSSSLLYTQDGCQFIKLIYPMAEGLSWMGNTNIDVQDSAFSYFNGWNYKYQNMGKSYNNGYINFDKTVTVLENDESVNYPTIDSNVYAMRTYAKEVYGYNVGMIYKEWTHWTYTPAHIGACVKGYSVVMRAIDYN